MASLAELWQQYQAMPVKSPYYDVEGDLEDRLKRPEVNFRPENMSQWLFEQGYVSPEYYANKQIAMDPTQYINQWMAPGAQPINDPNFGTVYQRPTWEQAQQRGLWSNPSLQNDPLRTEQPYYDPLFGADQALAAGVGYGAANEGGGGLRGVLNENVDWAVPAALAAMGGYAAGGAAGLYGAEAGAGAGAGAGLGEGVGADAYFAGAAPATTTAGEFSLAGGGAAGSPGLAGGTSGLGLATPASGAAPLVETGLGGGAGLAGGATGLGVLGNASATGTTASNTGIGSAAAGTALSRILNGTATTADWVQILGTAGATGLGMFSANQQANTLERLAQENRADRLPYLQASQGYLADPGSYLAGPGQAAMKGTLARLSATHGNPIGSPTAMAISNEAALRDWRDAVTGFGNMGLSGADTRANLGMAGARATGDIYSNLAGGISDIVNPRRSLADLAREYNLSIGGVRV